MELVSQLEVLLELPMKLALQLAVLMELEL